MQTLLINQNFYFESSFQLARNQAACGGGMNAFLNRDSVQDQVTRAEVLFGAFVAEHNLPFAVAEHFSQLVKKMFPDSDIAKRFRCGKTKVTQIIKGALSPALDKQTIELCQQNKFSILCDGGTDVTQDKPFCVIAQVETENGQVKARLLDMPICNEATGEKLFDAIDQVLT